MPVVPHLVDRHQFFTAPGTPGSVIGWMVRHRPAGSTQGDSGGGTPGEQWTSFDFTSIHGFRGWPDLAVNAVRVPGSKVAVRVDAQVAPRPRLPGNGRGAGDVRVVDLGTMLGSFGYELRCGPAGGTVPDPARICAAIGRDPALLYSFPGPDHSCPPGGPTVSLAGRWHGKPLHSRFSVCTGGQEQQAGAWAGLLPSTAALGTVHIDQGIGLVSLGEREAAVVSLLRGQRRAPAPCRRCTLSFGAGVSVGYGGSAPQPAGWTVSFTRSRVTQIETGLPVTVAGANASSGLASLRRRLPGWRIQKCGPSHALVPHLAGREDTARLPRRDLPERDRHHRTIRLLTISRTPATALVTKCRNTVPTATPLRRVTSSVDAAGPRSEKTASAAARIAPVPDGVGPLWRPLPGGAAHAVFWTI